MTKQTTIVVTGALRVKNIVMKQSKGLNGDLKPEHKESINNTTMGPNHRQR